MANMYPAIRAHIGRWTYFMVKMSFNELAKEVQLSSDVHQDKTLDEAIQREVNNSRARQNLVVYLHDRDDRFLNSIVVAALGGSPTFVPLQLAETPENIAFRAMEIDQSFGVLTFVGGQKYYALDGQHRLAAVRAILEPTDQNYDKFAREYVTPEFRDLFRDEEIAVIMVVQDPKDDSAVRDEVLKDYRRLFSSLNRYAKATDESTNIIMDEDDGIAILTRRLISEHEFFEWKVERRSEYSIVKTSKGKNLRPTDPYFTQIEVLYDMNLTFLTSSSRTARGWQLSKDEFIPQKDFRKIWKINRPDEDVLDRCYTELSFIWDAILETLPELRSPPNEMRVHNPSEDPQNGVQQDHVLFWPIGQEVLSGVVRRLLDEFCNQIGKDSLDKCELIEALRPLQKVGWSLHEAPWRHLLLVQSTNRAGDLTWGMRNEGRNAAVRVGTDVVDFIVGTANLNEERQNALKFQWTQSLVPTPDGATAETMWEMVLAQADGQDH